MFFCSRVSFLLCRTGIALVLVSACGRNAASKRGNGGEDAKEYFADSDAASRISESKAISPGAFLATKAVQAK